MTNDGEVMDNKYLLVHWDIELLHDFRYPSIPDKHVVLQGKILVSDGHVEVGSESGEVLLSFRNS